MLFACRSLEVDFPGEEDIFVCKISDIVELSYREPERYHEQPFAMKGSFDRGNVNQSSDDPCAAGSKRRKTYQRSASFLFG